MSTVPVIARLATPVLPTAPPKATAEAFASECDPGAGFAILRRVRSGCIRYRWEASEWRVRVPTDPPRCLHDYMGRHVCLIRVGFAFTAPGALRRMARCPDDGWAPIDAPLP